MNYKQAAREIATGTIRPLYVCYGPERFLMQEFIDFMIERIVEEGTRDFAISRFDLSETSLEAVLEDAETPAFLAPTKLVIAKDAAFLTAAKEGKLEHKPEGLMAYVKSPAPHSVVVLTVQSDKLDERKKVVKQLKDADLLIPFTSMTVEELQQWVRKRADKLGSPIEPAAVAALLQIAGTDLQMLSAELEKCSLYAGKGEPITAASVERLVSRTTEQDVFMLVEDIIKRRTDRALTSLAELLKRKEEPIRILLLIATQIRLIAMAKQLGKLGYSQQQIAGHIGVHPYRVKLALEQGGGYSEAKLRQLLGEMAELDYRMKTGQVDKVFGLELLLLRMGGL